MIYSALQWKRRHKQWWIKILLFILCCFAWTCGWTREGKCKKSVCVACVRLLRQTSDYFLIGGEFAEFLHLLGGQPTESPTFFCRWIITRRLIEESISIWSCARKKEEPHAQVTWSITTPQSKRGSDDNKQRRSLLITDHHHHHHHHHHQQCHLPAANNKEATRFWFPVTEICIFTSTWPKNICRIWKLWNWADWAKP